MISAAIGNCAVKRSFRMMSLTVGHQLYCTCHTKSRVSLQSCWQGFAPQHSMQAFHLPQTTNTSVCMVLQAGYLRVFQPYCMVLVRIPVIKFSSFCHILENAMPPFGLYITKQSYPWLGNLSNGYYDPLSNHGPTQATLGVLHSMAFSYTHFVSSFIPKENLRCPTAMSAVFALNNG